MNILHLVTDEKFILFFNNIFSDLPNVKNRYLVQSDVNQPLKYIKRFNAWRYIDKYYYLSSLMKEDMDWADCVIIHCMTFNSARIISNIPPHIVKIWSGWGRDYYYLMPGGEAGLLGDETASLLESLVYQGFSYPLLKGTRYLKKLIQNYFIKDAIKHINLFSSPIKNDFYLIKKSISDVFNAEYIQLNYGSIEQTFLPGSQPGGTSLGQNILVGNSATPANNHVEAFRLLAKNKLGNRKIITPLSYGDPKYKDAIIPIGMEILGNKFYPIKDFIPLEQYNKLILKCPIVIMNHRRQQALGNIGAMLYGGAKIFLDEINPLYHFFKENGAYVYSTRLLDECLPEAFNPLNELKIEKNKAILRKFWRHDIVMNNAQVFVDKVNELMDRDNI